MNKHVTDLVIGLGEPALDAIITNEIIKEIPVLGTVVRTARAGLDMRDRWFLKKIEGYIHNVGAITEEQKAKIREEVQEDSKRKAKFGESVFTVLEQSDSEVKVNYASSVFLAFINNEFSSPEFRRLNHAIKSTFTDYLVDFVDSIETSDLSALQELSNSGLMRTILEGKSLNETRLNEPTSLTPRYEVTKAGDQLREACRKYNKS